MTAPLNWQTMSAMQQSGNKKLLRTELRLRRAAVSREQKQQIDTAIYKHLIDSQTFEHAQTVFVYCSTSEEIDTYEIISECIKRGKRICVPRCEEQRGIMTARRIFDVSDLVSGKYGISEPKETAEIIRPHVIDFCIVPCLAADARGYRLGYGGGYYDRFLAETHCPIAVLCAEDRIFDQVPTESFDIPCDLIFTERRILICETYKT